MIMTTEDLLVSTKLKSMAPMSQITFKDADIVNMLNEEMTLSLLPIVQKMKENYFLRAKQVAIQALTDTYPLPERAIAGTLRDVYFVDVSGNKCQLKQMQVSEMGRFTTASNQPTHFIMYGDNLKLFPTPKTAAGFIEFWYYSRPSDLVLAKNCSKVLAVDDLGNGRIRLTTEIDVTQTILVGLKIDLITQVAPVMLACESIPVLASTLNLIEVLKTSVSDAQGNVLVKVGQVVALEGKTNTPIFPQEMHPILSQMGAARIVESLSDQVKAGMVQAKLAQMLENAQTLIANRIENESPSVKKSNAFGSSVRRNWMGG